MLDGYMARRMGINSVVGSYLDPLADKVLIAFVALAMVDKGLLHRKFIFHLNLPAYSFQVTKLTTFNIKQNRLHEFSESIYYVQADFTPILTNLSF